MSSRTYISLGAVIAAAVALFIGWSCSASEVVRPEEIQSMRRIAYDRETYAKLAALWKDYNEAYPSELSYANWVYAERYAGNEFIELANRGLKKYPSNPVLLYLASMEFRGASNDVKGRDLLERAVDIDPNYVDPWFSLITIYMSSHEEEKTNLALRKVYESGYIFDDVMDYNYNVLTCLDSNAVLITNGDNDTYPAWVLQRLMNYRPDVTVANMSLLNTDWYPVYLVGHGAPAFISESELGALRKEVEQDLAASKDRADFQNPYARPLLEKLIKAAEREGRPVYFALTLYDDDFTKQYKEKGRQLGLATLVTHDDAPANEQAAQIAKLWLESFRTGGLDSWRLRGAKNYDAGKRLVPNYGFMSAQCASDLGNASAELRLELFHWYLNHVDALLTNEHRSSFCQLWRQQQDIAEIMDWCSKQGCTN